MAIRMIVTKIVGQEQFVVEASQCNPVTGVREVEDVNELARDIQEALKLAEIRQMEAQVRDFEARGLRDWCTAEEWNKIVSVLDIIAGRSTAYDVVQRWNDAREENEDLIRLRNNEAMRRNGVVQDVTIEKESIDT